MKNDYDTSLKQGNDFNEVQIAQSREIAENWLQGKFSERGAYTQVTFDEETAQALGRIVIAEGDVTIAGLVRRLVKVALQHYVR